eukprot:gnl/TRDRNA2_/TRDRNA2_84960_c0_seq1.p1 gnl/TRDRNA2_/TRDRNA2_84960_c0~~gnl/TRDRNA2_/TRDRNA2_84960_c0_seq1.p1  ORF type:complete len:493 (-),score=29.37 gnl/TRDRNA2_/TRDRNA2_84960_c0_seq1:90-1568(-)
MRYFAGAVSLSILTCGMCLESLQTNDDEYDDCDLIQQRQGTLLQMKAGSSHHLPATNGSHWDTHANASTLTSLSAGITSVSLVGMELTTWQNSVVSVVLVYALFAFWSIFSTSTPGNSQNVPRDPVWDIAKFMLMCLVVHFHFVRWLLEGSDWWYTAWFMPALIFLSGICNQGSQEMLSFRLLWRVARDCVINNIFFVALLFCAGAPYLLSLWFLCAIGCYRLSILPALNLLSSSCGQIVGSAIGVALTVIIPLMWARKAPLNMHIHSILFLEQQDVEYIAAFAVYYAVGLVTPRDALKRLLNTNIVRIGGYVLMIAYAWYEQSYLPNSRNFQSVWYAPDGFYNSPSEPCLVFIGRSAQRGLLVLAFLACSASLASEAIKPIGDKLAILGQRTLYAYWLSTFLYEAFYDDIKTAMSPIKSALLLNCLVFSATVILCSPLTEWCFKWVVSPEWIFDLCVGGVKLLGWTMDPPAKPAANTVLDQDSTAGQCNTK